MSEVVKFYDEFTELQTQVGINNRHISIIEHLEKSGLRPNDKVLEIGCGIGTVSELILRYLSPSGYLQSIDISPKSIELAKQRLVKYKNVVVEVRDIFREPITDKFNVIVLPDVIEHIPIELHHQLFNRIADMLLIDGFVFIHIPHPNNLEWLIKNKEKGLQIIDQPIFTDTLCKVIYPLGFYIHYLKSYSIYTNDNDYQIIVLKKKPQQQNLDRLPSYFNISVAKRIRKKIEYVLRGFK